MTDKKELRAETMKSLDELKIEYKKNTSTDNLVKLLEDKKDLTEDNKTYIIKLETDKEYNGEGETFQEAFESMDLTWNMIKLKCNLIVSKGDKKVSQLFTPHEIRRLINSKLMRDIWESKFELRLK